VLDPGFMFRMTAVVTLVTGTMFLMWLGEQITERGLGNGISIIIFAGIAAGLPKRIGGLLELVRTGAMHPAAALFIACWSWLVTAFVVFVERGQRKILVNYAKRQVGNKIYGGQSSHLPLKLNMAGVIPPIFASSIILFPATMAGWFGSGEVDALAEGHRRGAVAGPADLRHAVRGGDHLLLLLLHGAGVQFEGDGGQPEEERRLRSRDSSRRADRALHRQDH
jgi:preprotein translocase subunit SecY